MIGEKEKSSLSGLLVITQGGYTMHSPSPLRNHLQNRTAFRVLPHRWLRPVATLLLVVLLAGCTRTVARVPMETRTLKVDWEQLKSGRLAHNSLVVESVPLTPAQWPLEASLKKLFQLDFTGVIEQFDLSFHSSKLESDVLKRLFDAGFLPVYMRVTNQGKRPVTFLPHRYAIEADQSTLLYPVSSLDLPDRFREIDWARTGATVVLSALLVVMVVLSGKEGRGGGFNARMVGETTRVGVDVAASGMAHEQARQNQLPTQGGGTVPGPSRREKGLLYTERLQPGEQREGFLFFKVDATVADWPSVRLINP